MKLKPCFAVCSITKDGVYHMVQGGDQETWAQAQDFIKQLQARKGQKRHRFAVIQIAELTGKKKKSTV